MTYEGAASSAPEIQPSLANLGLKIDMPARAPAISAAQQRLLALLAQRGYPLAEVTDRETFVQHEARTMTVHLSVDSGPLAHFGPQSLTGAESVEVDYLHGLVAWQEGDPYDRRKVEATREALSATRLFSSVQISHAETANEDGALPMTIELREGPHRSIGASISYATDIGFGTEPFWEHRNFFGANESLRLSLTASEIEQGGRAAFRKPAFLRMDQALLVQGVIGRRLGFRLEERERLVLSDPGIGRDVEIEPGSPRRIEGVVAVVADRAERHAPEQGVLIFLLFLEVGVAARESRGDQPFFAPRPFQPDEALHGSAIVGVGVFVGDREVGQQRLIQSQEGRLAEGGRAALFDFGGGQRQAQALVPAEIVSVLPERLDAEPDVGGI